MVRWEEPATVKIHEGCGGRVRWVEAIDRPGVGYTGDCTECLSDSVVVESIIPIEARGEEPGFGDEFDILEDVRDAPVDELAELEWDESADFEENQRRLRSIVLGEGGRSE